MGSHPVYHRLSREVVFTKIEVAAVTRRHFEELVTDESGVYGDESQFPGSPGPTLPRCEERIEWSEIINVLYRHVGTRRLV